MPRGIGKSVGKITYTTFLGFYAIEVHFSVEDRLFSARVPKEPGAKVVASDYGTFDLIRDKDMDALDRAVKELLRSRDTTEFVDVIEYALHLGFHGHEPEVGFDCRVERVSVVEDGRGCPRLHVSVDVDEDTGEVLEHLFGGEKIAPRAHSNHGFEHRVPYTPERWRKCRAIRDGIKGLKRALRELFDDRDGGAAVKIDQLNTALLLGPSAEQSGAGPEPEEARSEDE